ncbi:MAG: TSUP family transporter [Burkholderiales bacterium]|nr:TSUP family transporter [Burkholderiales bacterium]
MTMSLILSLAGVAFLAGFFDAIAGGGGLITLPALFLAGVPPLSAIATNKLQAASASVSATVAFARKGMIEWRTGRFLVLTAMVGGASGALLVSFVDKTMLTMIVPVLLLLVATYFVLAPKLTNEDGKQKISILLFSFIVAPALGFYDGVFGPGTGSFFMVAFVFLAGLGMIRAMSFTKLANASCNIGALMIFISKGMILWPLALAMAVASSLGAQLGARCAVRVGARLIKPMLVIMCCAMAAKLLMVEDNPLRLAVLNFIG